MNPQAGLTTLTIVIAFLHYVVCTDNVIDNTAQFKESPNVTEEQNVSSTTVLTAEVTTVLPPKVEIPSALPKRLVLSTDFMQPDPWLSLCEDCACDRIDKACDVGCCCDPFCLEDDRKAFTECENYVPIIQKRHCFRNNILFRNNSGYKLVNISDSLFCAVPESVRNATCHKHYQILTSAKQFERVTVKHGASVQPSACRPSKKRTFPKAKHGQPIVIEVNGQYRYLGFSGFITSNCTGVSPLLFLTDQEASCCSTIPLTKESCETTSLLNAAAYYKNVRVVVGQKRIPITPCICHSSRSCSDDVPSPVYNTSLHTCSNFVSEVHYMIIHNGSSGIANISAFFVLHTETFLPTRIQNWCQTFKVTYKTVRNSNMTGCRMQSAKPLLKRSGNPGYVLGAPVLVGRHNGSSINISSAYTLIQPVNDSSNCNLPQEIAFGENVKTGCTLSTEDQDPSAACSSLQHLTSQLFNTTLDRIGVFGNASPSKPDDWVQLHRKNITKLKLTVDRSLFGSSHFSSICRLIIDVKLTIVFADIGQKSNPQSKIVGALLTTTESDYEVICQRFNCLNEMYSVHVTFSISFFELSGLKE